MKPTVASATCYFYPRPPRGGRQPETLKDLKANGISIHALREEGDREQPKKQGHTKKFLSTPSARRATAGTGDFDIVANYFYPRPPRGGRRGAVGAAEDHGCISIHALREEGDATTFLNL